jgi:hypothetical protein
MTGADLLEHGLKNDEVELPLGPKITRNRCLRVRAKIIDKVSYEDQLAEADKAKAAAASANSINSKDSEPASTSSRLFQYFKKSKKKSSAPPSSNNKLAEEEGDLSKHQSAGKRTSNSAESVIEATDVRKDDLRDAEKSRSARSSSMPRQDIYEKAKMELGEEGEEEEEEDDEEDSLIGGGSTNADHLTNAWEKVLNYLHEKGDSK